MPSLGVSGQTFNGLAASDERHATGRDPEVTRWVWRPSNTLMLEVVVHHRDRRVVILLVHILDLPAAGEVTDAKVSNVAWSKITGAPTAFPPSGAATGDLSGTYPSPVVKQASANVAVGGNVTVTGPQIVCGIPSLRLNSPGGGFAKIEVNPTDGPGYDSSKSRWMQQFDYGPTYDWNLWYSAPGGGSWTAVLSMGANGTMAISGGTATKSTGTTWANPSDRRLKDEIADYTTGLDAILQLQPRTFVYNGNGGSTVGMRGNGFIADEVQAAMPEMIGCHH
jgi:hypothetical protein